MSGRCLACGAPCDGSVCDQHCAARLYDERDARAADEADAPADADEPQAQPSSADAVIARALQLVAASLTPGNQNVVNRDLCASINDLRQIALSATETLAEIAAPRGRCADCALWLTRPSHAAICSHPNRPEQLLRTAADYGCSLFSPKEDRALC